MATMVLTVLEARVEAGRAESLETAYRALASKAAPPGLLSSQLVRSVADSGVWRVGSGAHAERL